MTDYRDKIDEKRRGVVDTLMQYIENNPAAWERGWFTFPAGSAPQNASTGKPYRGFNALNLMVTSALKGYQDPRWVTFSQAKAMGAQVKPGEKSADIFFWSMYDKETKRNFTDATVEGMTAEERQEYLAKNVRPVLRTYNVFNAAQCSGMPKLEQMPESEAEKRDKNAKVERIIGASEAPIIHDQATRAYYSPAKDEIHLPPVEQFKTMEDYYATALHELAHSTGAESRLNRDMANFFGTPEYAREELRAELASVFMQIDLGVSIDGSHIENHASYLHGWLQAVKDDPNVFFSAAADAEKISKYVNEHYAADADVKTVEASESIDASTQPSAQAAPEAGSHQPPLVVNFYAGPGAGKTTAALEVTAALKKAGYNVEYVSEYAKELVLEKKLDLLADQRHVTDEQFHRLDRLRNSGVEVIVTDSPILLGKIYGEGKIDNAYSDKITGYYESFDNFNLVVKRGNGYQQEGRLESHSEAKALDGKITGMLKSQKLFYGNYQHNDIEKTVERIGKTFDRLYGDSKQAKATPASEAHPVFGTKKLAEEAGQLMVLTNRVHLAEYALDSLKREMAAREQGKHLESDLMMYRTEDLTAVIKDYDVYRSNEMRDYHKAWVNRAKAEALNSTFSAQATPASEASDSSTLGEATVASATVATATVAATAAKNVPAWLQAQRDKRFADLEKNVPQELKEMPCWCAFSARKDENGDYKKKIWDCNSTDKRSWAKSNDSTTWTSFENALSYARQNGCDGLSFVMTKDSGLFCIDLDDAKGADGKYSPLAWNVIHASKNTYVERSVSKTGLHVFGRKADANPLFQTLQSINPSRTFEMYDYKIISMTGDRFGSATSDVKAFSADDKLFGVAKSELAEKAQIKPSTTSMAPNNPSLKGPRSDREVMDAIQKSRKADEFNRMFRGEDLCSNRNRTDLRMLNILAFFTNGDADQMRRIFESSALYRPTGKSTSYLDRSINLAIKTVYAPQGGGGHGGGFSSGGGLG